MLAAIAFVIAAPIPPSADYQKIADTTKWKWDDKTATLAHSVSLTQSTDEIKVEPKDARFDAKVTFSKNGEKRFTLAAHEHTVFRIVGDTLVFAHFSPVSNGAELIAFDLKTGKQLWDTKLRGIGLVMHFSYRNRVNMEISNGTVTVFGNESFGKYVEIVDMKTGKTIGHKKFAKDAADQKP